MQAMTAWIYWKLVGTIIYVKISSQNPWKLKFSISKTISNRHIHKASSGGMVKTTFALSSWS
jgi:hypothetical protein